MARIPALGTRGEGWVLLQLLLLGAIAVAGLAGLANPWWDSAVRIVTSGAGVALGVAGAEQARRGLRDLGSNLTPLPHPTASAQLVETGIYGRVRHPIYGGLILMALGWALLAASLPALGLAVLLIPFFWLKSSVEERWLEGRFPAYAAYRRRTRRFIAWPG
jgi:protein-S-isoprenylcysteine O-methyltransferase Ste14